MVNWSPCDLVILADIYRYEFIVNTHTHTRTKRCIVIYHVAIGGYYIEMKLWKMNNIKLEYIVRLIYRRISVTS